MTKINTNHYRGRVTVTGLLGELESIASALSERQKATAFMLLLANIRSQTGTPFRQHLPKAGIYHAGKNSIEAVQ